MEGDLRTVGACSHRNKSDNSDTVDGLKPICTENVMMLGAKRAVFTPAANARMYDL